MRKRPDARALLYERIRTAPPKFVHVTGVPYTVEAEASDDPEKLDRVWMTLEVPSYGRIRASINTTSLLSKEAGKDPRVLMSILPSTWTDKPETGLVECEGQSYATLEAAVPLHYEAYEQSALCSLLVEKMKKAVRAEVWGDLYAKDHLGVRQIHCRRESGAVPADLKNRDGALKLYYAQENLAELFLFKFTAQS
jgi:hypothetical protein